MMPIMMVPGQRKIDRQLKLREFDLQTPQNILNQQNEMFSAKFRYLPDPDKEFETTLSVQPVSPVQRIISRLTNPIPKPEVGSLSFSSESISTPNNFILGGVFSLKYNQQKIEQLLENAKTNVITGNEEENTVLVNSKILETLLRDVSSLQAYTNHLLERLKSEKIAHERLQLLQANQCQELSDRVDYLETELAVASKHQVNCSICLDSVEEIQREGENLNQGSHSKTKPRILMSTFCGHLFCDKCLHKSMMVGMKGENVPSTSGLPFTMENQILGSVGQEGEKRQQQNFSCPRCRKTLPPVAQQVGKFAHQLFV